MTRLEQIVNKHSAEYKLLRGLIPQTAVLAALRELGEKLAKEAEKVEQSHVLGNPFVRVVDALRRYCEEEVDV